MSGHLLILSIVFLSSIIRFIKLGMIPAGISADEARFGLALGKVFGDWIISPCWIRIPFAILGVLSVYLFYKLIRKIFKNEKIALISSLLLSISPWHIQESRVFSWGMIFLTILIAIMYFMYDKFIVKVNLFTKLSVIASLILFGISVLFPSSEIISRVNLGRSVIANSSEPIVGKVFINKYVENFNQKNKILFENLDFGNLFFNGHPRERWGIEDTQKLILAFLPLILVGLFVIEGKAGRFLFSWWLVPLILLTVFEFRESHSLILTIPYIVLAALGLVKIFLKNKPAFILVVVLGVYELINFGQSYYLGYSENLFTQRRPVYENVAKLLKNIKKPTEKVVVNTRLIEPKVFLDFYLKNETQDFEYKNFVFWQESKDNKLFVDILPEESTPSEPLYQKDGNWPSTIEVLGEFYDKGKRQKVVIYRIK